MFRQMALVPLSAIYFSPSPNIHQQQYTYVPLHRLEFEYSIPPTNLL